MQETVRPGPYTPILATLGYIFSPDKTEVLLIRRDARPEDLAYGKYNGLGGKVEPGEDVATGMRRELVEEAGIEATEMALRGTVSWPGFGKKGEDWFGFIFLITAYTGTPYATNPSGKWRTSKARTRALSAESNPSKIIRTPTMPKSAISKFGITLRSFPLQGRINTGQALKVPVSLP